jgi:S-adenosyl-L-methionine hydrolase (adenosine-forming)
MPLITLLTDYGTTDPYVGELKGVLLSAAPGATLVDITHSITPGDIRSAAYVLNRTWPRFPSGTVHLTVVDPGVGTSRGALAISVGTHYFVGPDNGVFTDVVQAAGASVVNLPVPTAASPTFHGRDLFGPAAAALAIGAPLDALGPPLAETPVCLAVSPPHYEGKSVLGEVIHVDRFGNLITDLTPALVPPYAVLEVEEVTIGPVRRTFGDVPPGGVVAYLGSGGTIEIAVRDGSASRRLGLGVGGRVRARLG